MQAVILAAGLGNRLGDLTSDRPKALVRVGGRELILRVMDFLDDPAIDERLVVTGFEGEKLERFLAEHCPDVKTVRNPDFTDGSIRTIETALPHVTHECLIMNSDHIYPRRMMQHILENRRGLTAICDFDRALGPDDMKIKLDGQGRLAAIRKTLEDFDGGYIGMTCCPGKEIAEYRRAVAQTRQREGNACAVESVLGLLAGEGKTVNICDASGMQWLEVDTPDDLAHAEETIRNNPGFLS